MSVVAEHAVVSIQVADFAMAEPGGKATIVGSGISVLTHTAGKASTTRFSVVVEIEVPYDLLPQDFPIEVALVDGAGGLVSPGGGQPLRIAQLASVERPQRTAGLSYPREALRGRTRMVVDFAQGLPLPADAAYAWRVLVDGDETRSWTYPFAVATSGAATGAGPVIG
ncbi:hypothetical protein [Litorihabitans aurantiacus]|uniref:Uncharacterized protein n=1 Tax=Litorihabitans aurantiacus TaxID=1930061 RepID=A0AA37XHG2_9MICO|nr:hypothetical protein [Litorihabitans aurantiacus]GMA33422.1 hypothetical protein GCM10025875_34140 [Litorihabitans aurantiacus]